MKRYNTGFEIKVGIFVFIGLVILTSLILSIGEFYLFHPGYTIKVLFGFANGIEVGAPVRVAGVEIGEVEDIKLIFNEENQRVMVELRVWLREEAKLHTDAEARVNTLGLLGEKYLEIDAGNSAAPILQQGSVIEGVDPLSTEKLTEMGYATLAKVDQLISSLNEILDEETKSAIQEAAVNSKEVTERLISVSSRMEDVLNSANIVVDQINSGEGTVGRLIYDDSIYAGFDEFIQDIKAHPWKLLRKGREKEDDDDDDKRDDDRSSRQSSTRERSQGNAGLF